MLRRFVRLCCVVLVLLPLMARLQHPVATTQLAQQADRYFASAIEEESEARSDSLNRLALRAYDDLLRDPSLHPSDFLWMVAHARAGEIRQFFGQFAEADAHYRAAIEAGRRAGRSADSMIFRPLIFRGIIAYAASRFDSARHFFEGAEELLSRQPRPLPEAGRLYNNMGALLFESGNYRQAANHFRKALDLLPRQQPAYKDFRVNYENNLATIHIRLGEYDSAIAIYDRLLPIAPAQPELRNNKALAHLRRGEAAEALRLLRGLSYGDAREQGLWNDRAEAFLELRRYDSAALCLRQAETVSEQGRSGAAFAERGRTLQLQGRLDAAAGRVDAAAQRYQQALQAYYPGFSNADPARNPDSFGGLYSYNALFGLLLEKARLYRAAYRSSHRIADGDAALNAYRSAFALTDHVARTYESDEARNVVQQLKYGAHSEPIDLAFALHRQSGDSRYLDAAFHFDQQNKASLEVFRRQQEQSAPAGDTLQQKARSLRREITRLSLLALQSRSDSARAVLEAALRNGEIELGRVLRRQPSAAPPALPSAADVQRILDERTVVLSYHLSADTVTIFEIGWGGMKAHQQRLYPGFRHDIDSMLSGLREPEGNMGVGSAGRLYRFLLGTGAPGTHLVLVPDDELLFLPFESLWSGKRYLLEECAVQYLPSVALLRSAAGGGGGNALAMAPFSAGPGKDGGGWLPALPASEAEAKATAAEPVTGARATKAAFLQAAPAASVVHLATHAVANNEHPELSYIAFAGGQNGLDTHRLYAGEIYGLEMNANHLLILSACETGNGALSRGEGLLSLSRAFAYAGCANRVTALWKADDAATAYLMRQLQYHLSEGKPVAEALRASKLAYLADPLVHPRRKAPFYWAHLVFSGDLPARQRSHWWLLVLPAVLLLSAWLLRRKTQ